MNSSLLVPTVLAAVIAASVSLLGVLVSFAGARWQLTAALRKVEVDMLALRQNLLRDVMGKRMEAYQKLWSLLQANVSDRITMGKAPDLGWLEDFFSKVTACHADYGVFFSERVYVKLLAIRQTLFELRDAAAHGVSITPDDMRQMDLLWSGEKATRTPGLATLIKEDLGSYEETAFRVARTN